MAGQDERIKGLDTQVANIRDRLSNVEGQLQAMAAVSTKSPNVILIALLSVVGAGLIGYWAWLGTQVVDHGKKFVELYGLVAPEKLTQISSQPTTPANIEAAKKLLVTVQKSGVKLPVATVKETGEKFVSAAELNPQSWDAALAFLNYRSFLNASSMPVATSDFSSSGPQMISAFEFSARGTVDFSWANQIVSVDQSYIYQKLDHPVVRKVGHPYLLVSKHAEVPPGTIELDGYRLRNVIFDGVGIFYNGGPLILENVYFINCKFEVARGPAGIGFARTLLAPNPAVSFNNS